MRTIDSALVVGSLLAGSLGGGSVGAPPGAASPGAAAGATWRRVATCEQQAVQRAVNAAPLGAVVDVPAGDCAWPGGITIPDSKRLTLRGAGRDRTHIAGGIDLGASRSRVTGFEFTDTVSSAGRRFRVDHCRLTLSANGFAVLVSGRGSGAKIPQPRGRVDHNEIVNGSVVVLGTNDMFADGGEQQQWLWARPLRRGGGDAVYIEDNLFRLTLPPGVYNFVDGNYGGSYVFRYNTVRGGWYAEAHSSQEAGNRAIRSWEIYGNTIDNPDFDVYFPFRIRGGTGEIFGNRITGRYTNLGIAFDNVRSYAPAGFGGGLCNGTSSWDGNRLANGYPCRDQVGRGPDAQVWDHDPVGAYSQTSAPAYVWSNRSAVGAELPVRVINQSEAHIKSDRDFFTRGRPFTGRSGIGVGRLSDRPGTCVPGVGYWATNQTAAEQRRAQGAGHVGTLTGTLFTCDRQRAWRTTYVPHRYPYRTGAARRASLGSTRPTAHHPTAPRATVGSRLGIASSGDLAWYDAARQRTYLDAVAELGVRRLRIGISWSAVQPTGPDAFDWSIYDRLITRSLKRGIKPLLLIAYTPAWAADPACAAAGNKCRPASARAFGKFAGQVAKRYAPRGLHHFEIWNEPNISSFFLPAPDAAFYARMLTRAAGRIRAVDAHGVVLTGGTAPAASDGTNIAPVDFLTGLYAAGAGDAFDAVAHHPYCYAGSFDCPNAYAEWSAWSQMSATTPSLHSVMVAHGDRGKSIWATEFGAPTHGSGSVTQGHQARLLVDAIQRFGRPAWAGPLFVYTLEDLGTDQADREDWFGLIRVDGSRKRAFVAVRRAARRTG